MSGQTPRRSPLALVLLALVYEEPMHPYRMRSLIQQRAKDQVVNVRQRNSVYQTVERLHRSGLVAVRDVVRDERRPDRTEYTITPDGERTLHTWMREILSEPAQEYPAFPAALATLPVVTPDEAAAALEGRVAALAGKLAAASDAPPLPRLFLLEDEYQRAVEEAELRWLRQVVADLRSGELTWDRAWLERTAADAEPDPPRDGARDVG